MLSSANSFAKLQNYSLCESPINSLEVPKSEKTSTTKEINKSLKKHHRYIYWVSQWLVKIQSPRPLRPLKETANLNLTCKNIQSKNKKQSQKLPATIEKIKFLLSKKTVYGSFR